MNKVSAQKLRQYFREKGIDRPCESCGHNQWLLLTNFATLVLQDSEAVGISSYPVVVIECQNCGQLRFYNRDKLGVEDTIDND